MFRSREQPSEALASPAPAPAPVAHDHLVGGRCLDCGATTFPAQSPCLTCLSKHVEPAPLSRAGVLYSFSKVHVASSGFAVPYTVAYVDLPEGVRIFGRIEGTAQPSLGDVVDVIVETDAQHKGAVGYTFRKATDDA